MYLIFKCTEMQVDAQLILLFTKGPCEFEEKILLSSIESRNKTQYFLP